MAHSGGERHQGWGEGGKPHCELMVGAACLSGGELTSEMGKTQEPGADGCAEDVRLEASPANRAQGQAWL